MPCGACAEARCAGVARDGRRHDIAYTAAWLPPPNVVKSLPRLEVIFSLGAASMRSSRIRRSRRTSRSCASTNRPHHADDRVCGAACADASPAAAAARRKPEAEDLGSVRDTWGERPCRRHHGLGVLGQDYRREAPATSDQWCGMEPDAEAYSGRSLLCRACVEFESFLRRTMFS